MNDSSPWVIDNVNKNNYFEFLSQKMKILSCRLVLIVLPLFVYGRNFNCDYNYAKFHFSDVTIISCEFKDIQYDENVTFIAVPIAPSNYTRSE